MTRTALSIVALSALGAGFACEPKLVAGQWTCSPDGTPDAGADASTSISVPWSTSFEDRFCDYTAAAGFCYGRAPAKYATVSSPSHSGGRAAAFTVVADDSVGFQARCVRQGVLPQAAYYGAWFFRFIRVLRGSRDRPAALGVA